MCDLGGSNWKSMILIYVLVKYGLYCVLLGNEFICCINIVCMGMIFGFKLFVLNVVVVKGFIKDIIF